MSHHEKGTKFKNKKRTNSKIKISSVLILKNFFNVLHKIIFRSLSLINIQKKEVSNAEGRVQ